MKSSSQPGLALDDFLWATDAVRKEFNVPAVDFGWNQIKRYAQAQDALDTLIDAIIGCHDSRIYSRPHSLLSPCGANIYAEQTSSNLYARNLPEEITPRESLAGALHSPARLHNIPDG